MMSSTFARFQAPVHAYGHPETEPHWQQPYHDSSHHFSSYSADSRSLADDANSYAHTEDHYDPRCSYVPYGLEYSQIEETDEALGYGPVQNNGHASPQLLCPRPILPPSQFSPHFSWYDWPSEAPANVYQAERSRNTSTSLIDPHLPQAGEIQHSFGNQQFTSKFYPAQQEFAESFPNPLASSHLGLGDGHTQPIVAPTPSFDQGSTRSTHFNIQLYTVHQPVSPEQRSSYSELAPNLNFMNSQTKPPLVHKEPSHTKDFSIPKPKTDAIAKGTISSLDVEKNPFALGFDGPPLTAFGRKVPLHAPHPVPLPLPLNPSRTSDRIGYDSTISGHHMEMVKAREPPKLG